MTSARTDLPFVDVLLAAAERHADSPALVHRADGVSMAWRWNAAVAEIDRCAAGFAAAGVRPGDLVVVSGPLTAVSFLAAAGAKAAGARLATAGAPTADQALGFLRDPAVSAVIASDRATAAIWRYAALKSRPVTIAADADALAAGSGGRPLPFDRLRSTAEPRGWAERIPDQLLKLSGARPAEPDGDHEDLLQAWLAFGAPLEFAAGPSSAPDVPPLQIAAPDAGFAFHFLGLSARVLKVSARCVPSARWRTALTIAARLLVQQRKSGIPKAPAAAGWRTAGRPLRG